jgi:hypothetical protein
MNPENDRDILVSSLVERVPSWIVNLWMAFVLLSFFAVRVLGSATGRHLLSLMGLRRGE